MLAAHAVEALGEATFLDEALLQAGELPAEKIPAKVQQRECAVRNQLSRRHGLTLTCTERHCGFVLFCACSSVFVRAMALAARW